MILTQSTALLVDAYRELNARKLFWITMGLNIMVVALFASLGISEQGPTFWHWTFDNPFFNSTTITPELFYKFQFVTWGIPVWLSWVATILALVSTAGIIPDLLSGGSIETMVSKPISRVRLFLSKYTLGLLFATLQVTVFSLGCFLVIWIRGGAIEPSLFMAVPIVIAFYSFLYSFCALMGVLTRSTIAALLITILFWFVVFLVNTADDIVLAQREGVALRVEDTRKNLENQTALTDRRLTQIEQTGEAIEDNEGNAINDPEQRRFAVNPMLRRTTERLEEAENSLETWSTWTDRVILIKTILPKTQETIGLLSRHMISQQDLNRLMAENAGVEADFETSEDSDVPAMADPRVPQRIEEAKRGRTVAWILGTSFLFELIMVALATALFARRDF